MITRLTLAVLLLNAFYFNAYSNDYEDAWKALHRNDRQMAKTLLQKAMQDPQTAVDAYITYTFIRSFEGTDKEVDDLGARLYDQLKDPNPYLFALWFNPSALGGYGKKTGHQLQLLQRLLTDSKVNGSIRAAAHYFKALHNLYSNDIDGARKEWTKVGSAGPFWQLAGPFDNLGGSGYYKDYGPLQHPESDATFTSVNNAVVKWFSPPLMSTESYAFPYAHFQRSTAVVYAQTFVYSPDDRKLFLQAGMGGTLKVWINDRLALACDKELLTEMDYFRQEIRLKKGYNRLLVQLGYEDNSSPNFIIRFTDNNYSPVGDLTYSAANQPYTKDQDTGDQPTPVRHFAEAFFEQKIKSEPDNLVNYILLTDVYLRSKKTTEARKVIEDALKIDPDNSLVRAELMEVLIKESNRTRLMEEAERMKEKDPDCLLTMRMNIQRLTNEEKYDEAFKELDRSVQLFGEDEDSRTIRIGLYSKQGKRDELVKAIEEGYAKYPNNTDLLDWMHSLKVDGYKDARGGLEIYENFLKNNYSYKVMKQLADEYNKQGMSDKALKLLEAVKDIAPYNPALYTDVSSLYFDLKEYAKAADYGRKALTLAPYVGTYWENLALELQQQHIDAEAIQACQKALYYDATNYSAREKLRDLQKKPSLWKAFPETDPYKAIRDAAGKTYDHNYFYVLDEKFAVIHPEGNAEEYTTTVVKILNQKGIDSWKEYSIGYNSNTQVLKVEKAEVVKKSGSVVPAEQNDNQIVFTGLEAGDAIVLKYKIQHYEQGRISRHFSDKFIFNAFVPELLTRYCLLVSNKVKFDYKMVNGDVQPAKTPYEDFTLYTWQMNNPEVFKSEDYMPPLQDVGPTLHISTLNSWSEIANWYNDLSNSMADDDFEVREVFKTLFPQGTAGVSDKEKAMRIYRYIAGNIHYSSVSFRQGAFVPQKASVTINTRLGDCKDLSSLFVALSRLAGVRSCLVLVNTRDNGQKSMELPSVEFNHCIVKTWIDGKPCFLELTDNNLPFACVPSNLFHASCLVIPSDKKQISDAKLEWIEAPDRPKEIIRRKVNVRIEESNLRIHYDVTKTGSLVSGMRDVYESLSFEKQKEEMQQRMSSGFKNGLQLDSISFEGLHEASDSVHYKYSGLAQNEVIEVGKIRMIKVPFTDVTSMDNFTIADRKFPVELGRYESADAYEEKLTIQAPAGAKFADIPENESFGFGSSRYSIQYVRVNPATLTVIQRSALQRNDVAAVDYKALRDFLSKIVKAQSKYITFK
ncbi:DUF3857 domain-containing protein [Flavitalea sp. BT771]|uniref:DUF3857 domain-containing protein n=1 Tax=Flavitalea sp. BT771 TaxID=3063329 RepID=UPI0026E1A55A|nr:DUF3857 domain-containing protein [Flavitalea sp. BT771]MDO6429270.1 DUF3857 domain-containing protein [Flavitalea sp. BT771]MDV6218602.1 DUF3857 domain-containing protein [Flavitalea sp. BT771]